MKKLLFNTNPNVVILKKLIVKWLKTKAKLGMVARGEKKKLKKTMTKAEKERNIKDTVSLHTAFDLVFCVLGNQTVLQNIYFY